jgi:hypothetical protein
MDPNFENEKLTSIVNLVKVQEVNLVYSRSKARYGSERPQIDGHLWDRKTNSLLGLNALEKVRPNYLNKLRATLNLSKSVTLKNSPSTVANCLALQSIPVFDRVVLSSYKSLYLVTTSQVEST